ncbi:MAG: DUF1599 domain-containing protein [Bacteroidota bacterium]|nr:DUF1599 domain-containing protein [Bacteroidota bacterium]
MNEKTLQQFDIVIGECETIFSAKVRDYGLAWRILRVTSLTDQIYIKANRIRSIQEKGIQKVEDGIETEFVGIINYSVMALIQLELGASKETTSSADEIVGLYKKHITAVVDLMKDKNHDYDEAWRNMRISSFTDIILMKLLRVKQIEDNKGKTVVSEGLDANYSDIINYAIFALIKIDEAKQK